MVILAPLDIPNHVHARFINRFRNPTKLQSEAGYYLSSLVRGLHPCAAKLKVYVKTDGCGLVHRDDGSFFSVKHHPRRIREVRGSGYHVDNH